MDSPGQPTVSVVIPTSNRSRRLPRLLDALEPEPATEVIVVVNGPPDGSIELLERRAANDSRLRPIRIPEADLAAAQQLGAEMATGDVVLWLDDDVLPCPGLIEGHARHHAFQKGLVVVGYMPVEPHSRHPGGYGSELYRRSYEEACRAYERDASSILHSLWGGNVSMRRTDLLSVGFTPSNRILSTSWYHQDLDFGLRCRAAGFSGVFDRSLRARHEHKIAPEAFLRLSREAGKSRWVVHSSHPRTLGPLARDFAEDGVPQPGRTLVRLSRRRRARYLVQGLLRATVSASGAIGLLMVESHAAYLMGKVEQQQGATEAAREIRFGAQVGADDPGARGSPALDPPPGAEMAERRVRKLLGITPEEGKLLSARARANVGDRAYVIRLGAFLVATMPILRRAIPRRLRRRAIRPLVHLLLPWTGENLLYAQATPSGGDGG